MFICGWEPTALVKKPSELKANDTTASQQEVLWLFEVNC